MTFLTGAMNYFVNSLVCNKLSSQVIKIQLHGSLSFHLSTRFSLCAAVVSGSRRLTAFSSSCNLTTNGCIREDGVHSSFSFFLFLFLPIVGLALVSL